MKRLCAGAGVDPAKVHPHALRHLFARTFYEMTRDLTKLADLLGHSSIETTRIYIMTSVREHRTILDRLAENLGTKKPPHRSGKRLFRT
jgi:site-specific recombinase XerD